MDFFRRCRFIPGAHPRTGNASAAVQGSHHDRRALSATKEQATIGNQNRPEVHGMDDPTRPRHRLGFKHRRVHRNAGNLDRRGLGLRPDKKRHF